VIKEQFDTK